MLPAEPPASRRIIAQFQADLPKMRSANRLRNLVGASIGLLVVTLPLGWLSLEQPLAATRNLGLATVGAFVVLVVGLLIYSDYRARRAPQYHCILTDWGIEFDAPRGRPDLQPPESGGALRWSSVGEIKVNTIWFERMYGLADVTLKNVRFQTKGVMMSWPRGEVWGIRVPWLTRQSADELAQLAINLRNTARGISLAGQNRPS
jgi:hypothetical protein